MELRSVNCHNGTYYVVQIGQAASEKVFLDDCDTAILALDDKIQSLQQENKELKEAAKALLDTINTFMKQSSHWGTNRDKKVMTELQELIGQ